MVAIILIFMSKEQEAKLDQVRAEAISNMKKDSTKNFHTLSIDQAYSKYGTDPTNGLTSRQVIVQREKFGSNELSAEEEKSLWERIVEQFEDVLVRILLLAASISFFFALVGKYFIESQFFTTLCL